MRKMALMLAILTAGSSFAGDPAVVYAQRGALELPLGKDVPVETKPSVIVVGPGYWMTEAKVRARYEETLAYKYRAEEAEKNASEYPHKVFLLGTGIGFALSCVVFGVVALTKD